MSYSSNFVPTQDHISLDTLEFYGLDIRLDSENTHLRKVTSLVSKACNSVLQLNLQKQDNIIRTCFNSSMEKAGKLAERKKGKKRNRRERMQIYSEQLLCFGYCAKVWLIQNRFNVSL